MGRSTHLLVFVFLFSALRASMIPVHKLLGSLFVVCPLMAKVFAEHPGSPPAHSFPLHCKCCVWWSLKTSKFSCCLRKVEIPAVQWQNSSFIFLVLYSG